MGQDALTLFAAVLSSGILSALVTGLITFRTAQMRRKTQDAQQPYLQTNAEANMISAQASDRQSLLAMIHTLQAQNEYLTGERLRDNQEWQARLDRAMSLTQQAIGHATTAATVALSGAPPQGPTP